MASIKIRDNGPLLVTGPVTITDADGNQFESADIVALCRCGHSGKKPFCDGTHRVQDFQSSPRAEQAAGQS